MTRSLSTATRPSSGSSAIVWPFLTFFPPIVASRTASVTDDRLDGPAGLRHRADIRCGVHARVEREQRGEALGGVPRRDDRDGALGQRRDLPRRQHDVRIVREQEDLAGLHVADGLEQLAGARVGRLAALDD